MMEENKTQKVSDYIMDLLYKNGVRDIFMLPGGANIHMATALMHSKIGCVTCHDEQACGFAAEAYARYKQSLAVVMVTSGPGVTHTISAVVEAFNNSAPVLFISGQVTRNNTLKSQGVPEIRQIGVQEVNVVPIVESITKYAKMVDNIDDIKYCVEKAIFMAKEGRPGSVWLDIPVDIQGAQVNTMNTKGFYNETAEVKYEKIILSDINYVAECLSQAQRPVILVGQGVRIAKAEILLRDFILKYNLPFVSSYLGLDIIESDMKNNMGNIGFKGSRHSNIIVENADLILCIGSRLSLATVGYASHLFGREAKIITVDINPFEHKKSTVKIDRSIVGDAKEFLQLIEQIGLKQRIKPFNEWLSWCTIRKEKYPVCMDSMREDSDKGLNLYHVIDQLTKIATKEMPIVTCTGSALFVTSQVANFKEGQRYIPSGCATMGYALPAAIGVSYAIEKKPVIVISGDGSFQQNLQELQTVVHNQLPIKIFYLNNGAYYTMKPAVAKGYDAGYFYGELKQKVSFPSMKKIAKAYGIKYLSIETNEDIQSLITEEILKSNEAIFFDLKINEDMFVYTVTTFHQKDGSIVTRPIEDVYPYLERKELLENMIVQAVEYK